MSKKRRTKQQKIIARLRRQLQENQNITPEFRPKAELPVEPLISFPEAEKPKTGQKILEKKEILFAYDPLLIKKNLIKTLFISLFFLGTIFFIKGFFRL